jgi:hypothetical protein
MLKKTCNRKENQIMNRLLTSIGIFFMIYLPLFGILFLLGLEVGIIMSNYQRIDGPNFVILYLSLITAVIVAVPSALLVQRFLRKRTARN